MDNIKDITKIIEEAKNNKTLEHKNSKEQSFNMSKKTTNPIIKKLIQFQNEKLSNKFDINDLLR